MTVPPPLRAALEAYAARDRVLLASDFDGVLAPLVDDPDDSRPLPGCVAALTRLAGMPRTTVALVSGRSLESLIAVSGLVPGGAILLYGSHGAEFCDPQSCGPQSCGPESSGGEAFASGVGGDLSPAQHDTLAALDAALRAVIARHPGSRLETKPMSRVVHTRGLDPELGRAALVAAEGAAAAYDVDVIHGKDVVEALVARATKGGALAALAGEVGAEATLYLGDDRTDETVFALLGPADVGVKVGPGETQARYRVADPVAAREILDILADLRA
jgi:trehalose 6-phosphate phosphatase